MKSQRNPNPQDEPVKASARKLSPRKVLLMGAPFAVIAVVLAIVLPSRFSAQAALREQTHDLSVLTVSVTRPSLAPMLQEVILPASVRAYLDTPIHAQTSGYLKRWLVDIGTPVKAGQLLADIDTPEVDDSLRQTQASQVQAQADYDLAQVTADRWNELAKTDAVAKQEVDMKVGDARSKRAVLDQMRASVARLQKLEAFKHVYAPYSGVITVRNTEVGNLITAGNGAPGTELFHLASTDRLRVFADVPETYAGLATVGQEANIELVDQPGEALHGTISRRAEAIDPVARTLRVELDVDNPGRKFLAGSFAQIRFRFRTDHPDLTLPANALLFRPEGVQVAVVDAKNTIRLASVKLGRDDGKQVEVLQGLAPGDGVVLNPPDSIMGGQVVRVAQAAGGG